MRCHAGCKTEDVLKAAGLSHLLESKNIKEKRKVVQRYNYTDFTGKTICTVFRTEPKGFFRKPKNIKDVPPYNLKAITESNGSRTCFICEGEKDANVLIERGYLATCNISGAANLWPMEYDKLFQRTVIVEDNDLAGRERTIQLMRRFPRSRIIAFPHEAPHFDLSDYLKKYSIDNFLSLIGQFGQMEALIRIKNIADWSVYDGFKKDD